MMTYNQIREFFAAFQDTRTGKRLEEYLASQTALAEAQRRQIEDRIEEIAKKQGGGEA